MRYMLFILLFVAVNSIAAPISKCIDPGGRVTFTQGGCPQGHSAEEVRGGAATSAQPKNQPRSTPAADKYVKPLDLDGDVKSRVRKIKAVVDIGRIKAGECDWDLKVSKNPAKCMDLLAYLVEGSVYNQAMEHASNLTEHEMREVQPELRQILRAVEDILQAKELTLAYTRN